MHAYTEERATEGLANEIGRYCGEVRLPDGTNIVTIGADGSWTAVKADRLSAADTEQREAFT